MKEPYISSQSSLISELDLPSLRSKRGILASRYLGSEQSRGRELLVAVLKREPLLFVDTWLKVFEGELEPAVKDLVETILPGLATLPTPLITEDLRQAIGRDISRICLAGIYHFLQNPAFRRSLTDDKHKGFDELWSTINGPALTLARVLGLPSLWDQKRRTAITRYPSLLVGEELLPEFQLAKEQVHFRTIASRLQNLGVSVEQAESLSLVLLTLARRAEEDGRSKAYEVVCLLASLPGLENRGGVIKARVIALSGHELLDNAPQGKAILRSPGVPNLEILPWSRYELAFEESIPNLGDGYRNLVDEVLPALCAIAKSQLSVDLSSYHFRIALEPAESYYPQAHAFVGESLGLPIALAAYAATQDWAGLPPVAATGIVKSSGQVTSAGLEGINEKVSWLLKYNEWLEKNKIAAIRHLYVPDGPAVAEATSLAGDVLKINSKVMTDERILIRTIGDVLDPGVLWDAFDRYLDRVQRLFPYDDPHREPTIWGVTVDDPFWTEDVERLEKMAKGIQPGNLQIFPLRYRSPIAPVLGYLGSHFAKERISSRQMQRRAPLPVIIDWKGPGTREVFGAIGESVRDTGYGDPLLRQLDIQNAWVQDDGLVLIFHAIEDYGHNAIPETQSELSPLVWFLKAQEEGFGRHRVIVIARNLHQMIFWSRQLYMVGLLQSDSSLPEWWRTVATRQSGQLA